MERYLIIVMLILSPWTLLAQDGSKTIVDGYSAMTIDKGLKYSQSGIRVLNTIPTHNKSIHLSVETFVLDQGFAQVLVGPEFKIKSTFISTLVGIVNNKRNPLGLGLSLLTLQKKWESLIVLQWAKKSGYFYISKLVYKVNNVGIGVRSQRHLSTGLYIDYAFSKKGTLWLQSGYDFEHNDYGIAIGTKGSF